MSGVSGALASTHGPTKISVSTSGLKYTVRKGDSLIVIAARHKVTLEALLFVNSFEKTTVIIPFQVITLPPGAVLSANPQGINSTAPVATYLVQKNDSITAIAAKAQVSLTAFLAVNMMTKASVIVPGQVVKLPSGAIITAPVVIEPAEVLAPAGDETSSNSVAARIQTVLDYARAQLGKPYTFGMAGPVAFDCSGLTMMAYKKIGVILPHQSLLQTFKGDVVDWKVSAIKPGDLIFTFSSRSPLVIGHVGIAISATQWIYAPRTGMSIQISNLPSSERIKAVRRLV